MALVNPKTAGPAMAPNFSNTEKEAEELRRTIARNHAGEQRTAQRLAAALDRRHHQRQDVEIPFGLHVIAHHRDERVHAKRDEDGRFCADASGQHSEQECERNADELDEQDSSDERALLQPDLGPVACRHADDGVDAVAVHT
jgi:hypothetical protein